MFDVFLNRLSGARAYDYALSVIIRALPMPSMQGRKYCDGAENLAPRPVDILNNNALTSALFSHEPLKRHCTALHCTSIACMSQKFSIPFFWAGATKLCRHRPNTGR
ncbi:uncharacterized protein MYCFIDRAFT_170344 [Pseudocercospora fijiensis CIRAD86]|uniref:Uncharacterized protein n=1 Tax=Pseudocercospora fijiensis (strain CIRAD86) TaxID=383855 RepID=N1Q7Q1_PSEFD|nr:uncharacterized protein MYCFIDRAFT_170344 [Pseudocercospora fijiensis CIRAD86]EME88764.1 hypothetical protein MYCFIDRAFT_170344 [Pseudocercospora fijiensis CIRAD86]